MATKRRQLSYNSHFNECDLKHELDFPTSRIYHKDNPDILLDGIIGFEFLQKWWTGAFDFLGQ